MMVSSTTCIFSVVMLFALQRLVRLYQYFDAKYNDYKNLIELRDTSLNIPYEIEFTTDSGLMEQQLVHMMHDICRDQSDSVATEYISQDINITSKPTQQSSSIQVTTMIIPSNSSSEMFEFLTSINGFKIIDPVSFIRIMVVVYK